MKISLIIEGSQQEILAVMERLGCTASEITAISARLADGETTHTIGPGPESIGNPICDRISERERQILSYLMEGVSNKEISKQLDITDFTVKQHVKNLLRVLGVANRTQAALWAQRHLPPVNE